MIELSPEMLRKLKVESGREVIVCAGIKKMKCLLKKGHFGDIGGFNGFNGFEGSRFSISRPLQAELHLQGIAQPLAFYFNENSSELKIGPVAGILSGIPVMMLEKSALSLYQRIAETARQWGMLCYFFTPDFINFKNETISGLTYSSNGPQKQGWIMKDFPWPDIVYNQAGFVSAELKSSYRRLLTGSHVKSGKTKLVNPFLALNDKLVNYSKMAGSEKISASLPETMSCPPASNLFLLLQKHSAVYLKPTASSRGFGVYKISRPGTGEGYAGYTVESHEPGVKKRTTAAGLSEELRTVTLQQPYLVQQAVELVRFQNRPVDFRVHVFKNEKGGWDILVVKARLGPVSGIVTDRLWGGRVMLPAEILPEIFSPGAARQVLDGIKETALKAAPVIEEVFAAEFGEMGFDIGVDGGKKPWILEVNPKPNWNPPAGADAGKLETDLAGHLLHYCRRLSGLHNLRSAVALPAKPVSDG